MNRERGQGESWLRCICFSVCSSCAATLPLRRVWTSIPSFFMVVLVVSQLSWHSEDLMFTHWFWEQEGCMCRRRRKKYFSCCKWYFRNQCTVVEVRARGISQRRRYEEWSKVRHKRFVSKYSVMDTLAQRMRRRGSIPWEVLKRTTEKKEFWLNTQTDTCQQQGSKK